MSDNKQQIELARETLDLFLANGEDMSEERHVVHYFYDGNFTALGEALRELGYNVRLTVGEDGVVAERHEIIGEDWRTTTLSHLCELADTYGVEYDGWEAAMMNQPDVPEPKRGGFFSKLFGKRS